MGPSHEPRIEAIDSTCTIGLDRLFIGPSLAERQITSRPFVRNLARVDLEGQISIYHPLHPGGLADRSLERVDPGDAGDQPVGPSEIKARIHPSAIIDAAARAVPTPLTIPITLFSEL
jgi:hypothetical protein